MRNRWRDHFGDLTVSQSGATLDNVQVLNILGCRATMINSTIEVHATDDDIASKLIVKLSKALMNKKLSSVKINLPTRVIFVSAKDSEHLILRAEQFN